MFTRNAVEFLEGVESYLPSGLCLPHHIRRILAWVDHCFNELFSACNEDVIDGTCTHLHVGSCFHLVHDRHTKGPSLDFLRQELMLMEPQVSFSAPTRSNEQSQDTPKPAAPTRIVIPQNLYRHLHPAAQRSKMPTETRPYKPKIHQPVGLHILSRSIGTTLPLEDGNTCLIFPQADHVACQIVTQRHMPVHHGSGSWKAPF